MAERKISTNPTSGSKVTGKTLICWLVTLGLPMGVMMAPVSEIFTAEIRLFFAVTLVAILMFAFELMDNMIPSLLLPFVYIVLELAPPNIAFAPWTTYIPWMMIGGLILANTLQNIGLLKRIAYWCIIRTGASYNGIIYGIMFAGIALNLVIPGNAYIPLAALTYGICVALDLGKSKESAAIMLTGAFGALVPMAFFYNPSIIGLVMGIARDVADLPLSWTQYLIHNIVFVVWCFILALIVTKLFKTDRKINGKEYFVEEYAELGRLSKEEKKGIFVVALLFIFLVSANIHGLAVEMGFVFAACLLYFPGINIGTREALVKVNYPLIFFVTACMAIGQVSNVLGVGQLISDALLPLMTSGGSTMMLIVVWILAVGVNLILTPLAAIATLTVPITQIALDMGINPLPVLYVFTQGLDQIFMPYEYALVLIFFSFGLVHLKDFVKLFTIKTILNLVFVLVIAVPFWKLIGLL